MRFAHSRGSRTSIRWTGTSHSDNRSITRGKVCVLLLRVITIFDHQVSGLVKAHEIFHRSRHRPDHLVARPNFRIQVQLLQPHYTSLALDLGVEATYQLFLIQDRQTEVAPFSSLCRLIALQNLNFDIGRNVFIKCVIF